MSYRLQLQLASRVRTELRPDPARCQAVSKRVWHIPLLCVQWKTPDGGQRNCPKHVEFYSKNEFDKLVHLVGFIIRIYHDARLPGDRQRNCPKHVEFYSKNEFEKLVHLVGFMIGIYHYARSAECQERPNTLNCSINWQQRVNSIIQGVKCWSLLPFFEAYICTMLLK